MKENKFYNIGNYLMIINVYDSLFILDYLIINLILATKCSKQIRLSISMFIISKNYQNCIIDVIVFHNTQSIFYWRIKQSGLCNRSYTRNIKIYFDMVSSTAGYEVKIIMLFG